MTGYYWAPTPEERDQLTALGFLQSPLSSTRWCRYSEGYNAVTAWVDVVQGGWKLTTFGEDDGSIKHDTFGLDLIAMLTFATVEGWL